MFENNLTKRRWFKKRYISLVLLVAFVFWGLWPMLAPRWDQDQCSFGEVTNERYWQMREEVRTDVKKAATAIQHALTLTNDELLKQYPPNKEQPESIQFRPFSNGIDNVILTKLMLQHTKSLSKKDEAIALMHAVMRELGGFYVGHQGVNKWKDDVTFRYVAHPYFFHNVRERLIFGLLIRYEDIQFDFDPPEPNKNFKYNHTTRIGGELFNSRNRYFRNYSSGGCPSSQLLKFK
ncbi:MAG: hypothetical protein ABJN57_07850 [Hyphomicrobiales bacterium]